MPELQNNRILIIDDNIAIHNDYRKILSSESEDSTLKELSKGLFEDEEDNAIQIHYEIDSAYQGEEGFELVKKALEEERPYAMAFVDIIMPPGWDGVQTIKNIWEIDSEIQVALCTAYSKYTWDDITKAVGISDRLLILKKPFDKIEIRQIACCLVTKWNLNQQVGHQYDALQNLIRKQSEAASQQL